MKPLYLIPKYFVLEKRYEDVVAIYVMSSVVVSKVTPELNKAAANEAMFP